MQINEVKNKLIEWLNELVHFKEKLIDTKSLVFQWAHSLEYELNIPEIENHVDDIVTSENIIAIMRNEMGIAWKCLNDETMHHFEDLQRLLMVYTNEMKLLEEWQLKLCANIELLIHKEFRMAS